MKLHPTLVLASAIMCVLAIPMPSLAQKAGDEALGTLAYDDFMQPDLCGTSCHVDFYRQWQQAMMSQAYTHHWDEIEYFKLAVPHAEKDPKVAGVKAGCNGCHSPIAFLAGDVPPPLPSANSRANESVSCEVCHSINGFKGDTPHNFNYISTPGEEIQLKLYGVSPAWPVIVWQRSQLTDSLAREFSAGFFGGTSPARKASGAWQPLQPAFTPATLGSFSACGTASSKYSISSQWWVYACDIIACSCWRAMSTWQVAHACGRSNFSYGCVPSAASPALGAS